jgi:hypothetical protein
MVQHIRPWKIMGALQHLKKVERNPHFEDTVINEHWQSEGILYQHSNPLAEGMNQIEVLLALYDPLFHHQCICHH